VENAANVAHTVGFFQAVFTIILALALGEALRQFVADTDDQFIHWNRLPALASFLFIIFPFFQGMSQHLYLNYVHPTVLPKSYAAYLMFDGVAFVLEAACFFLMSRALDARHWRRYYAAVLALLFIDTIWGGFTEWRGIHVGAWLYLNGVLAVVLLAVLWWDRHTRVSLRPSIICMATVFVTTITSYYLMRDVYFP
jgi:hypothetical protein